MWDFFTVFFWTNDPPHTLPFPSRWYHSSIQCVRPETSTLWLTALHPSKVPLCQDNAIHHLEGSRSGIQGVFLTSVPWRTRFRNALCEWTRHTSEVPPRRGWTPPTLQYSHNGTLRGLSAACGERGTHWSDSCLLRCLGKALLIRDLLQGQAAELRHCDDGEAGAVTLLMAVLPVAQAREGSSSYTPHMHAPVQGSPACARFHSALAYATSRRKCFQCYQYR